MTTTKLTRAQEALTKTSNELARAQARRDAAIKSLIKAEAKIKEAERTELRLAKRVARLRGASEPEPVAPPAPPALPAVPTSDDLDIPDYLRRQADEHRKQKARGRIAKLKAKQSGETKRMPLSGREAAAFLSGGE